MTVAWTTGFEVDNLGFNVYRENSRGRRELITPRLIAGSALVSTDKNMAVIDREYALTDRPPGNARRVRYWLEDIDTNGRSTMHGPIRITRAIAGDSAAGKGTTPITLDEVGRKRHDFVNTPAPFVPESPVAALPEFEAERTAAPPPAGNLDVAAVKLTVRSEGWYAVSAGDLAGLGLDLSKIDPRNMQLFAEGRQIPMLVTGEADGPPRCRGSHRGSTVSVSTCRRRMPGCAGSSPDPSPVFEFVRFRRAPRPFRPAVHRSPSSRGNDSSISRHCSTEMPRISSVR
ncbi:MAG: hypothetical protein IPF82_08720 [Blastocatellia bacterium]|nr:hypothetical protein [Blastocatellia bacterium]